MSKLQDSVDYSNLNFKYVDPKNNDVSFYGYRNSIELFNSIKDNKINFDDAVKKQNYFLDKLNNIKHGNKNLEKKEVINNLENFYISREGIINFLEIMEKWFWMPVINQNKMKMKEKDLKY